MNAPYTVVLSAYDLQAVHFYREGIGKIYSDKCNMHDLIQIQ